jgi:sulfur-carrier protein adenylyltransferase/sulfurtransferase
MKLSAKEVARYQRHLVLSEFGEEKQLMLKRSAILIVGAGGLGSPVLLYLAAAGIGELGIVDSDSVEWSNLQRQVIFNESDVGKNKAEAAAHRLKEKNSNSVYHAFPMRLTSENALDVLGGYDVVVDCTDNFATRYLLNDACVLTGKPLVYGSILKFEGHVAVFNHTVGDEVSANYRDLFPQPPDASSVPDCSQAGVLGILPGLIGCHQANEAIKIVTRIGEVLSNKLLIIDALSNEQTIITIKNLNSRQAIKDLIDYDAFCNTAIPLNENKIKNMKEVTVQELKAMKDSGEDFQLIDVREPHEYDICNLEGTLIPQGEIPGNVDQIARDKKVVVHCRSGARSGNMIQWLENNHKFTNLYNLKGGILAWAREVDPEMPTY